MLIPRVNLTKESDWSEKIAALSRAGVVCIEGQDQSPEGLADTLTRFDCIVGPIDASSVDLVTEWLNHGAHSVLVQGSLDEICELRLPRLQVLLTDVESLSEQDIETLAANVDSVFIKLDDSVSEDDVLRLASGAFDKLGQAFPSGFTLLHEGQVSNSFKARNDLVGKLHHLKGSDHPIHWSTSAVVMPPNDGSDLEDGAEGFCVGQSLISCLKTDRPDGLFATVVTDELGVALGLVYSSKQSILASISGGRAVYWSRSRQSLWRKGDTSGAYQELVHVSFDCDCDAVRYSVRQRGEPPVFCHKGFRSCWGDDSGIHHLFRTLVARKQNAPEGSYTKRLFDDRALLRNKLLEESQEVIEAVEENDKKHVAEEVADLAYFLFTACCAGDATLEDVSKVLDMRSRKVKRRPGNAKEFRIKAAEEALKKTDESSSS